MKWQVPSSKRSRTEQYRAQVHRERASLPFEIYKGFRRGVPLILGFGAAGVFSFRQGHYIAGALVCLASLIGVAYVGWTYFKTVTRRSDASARHRKRRIKRLKARSGR